MPGFVTHYIFGKEAYRGLGSNPLKENLYQNRAAYGLGLQGPDVFFYYLPSYALHGYNLGALAHTRETGAFFLALLRGCMRLSDASDRCIAEAYVTGFLGHYILDTTCHPYIYAMTHYDGRTKEYFSRHAYLETDIDTALLAQKLHRTPCNFHTADTLTLTRHQKKVIADLLYGAYRYAFPTLRIDKATMRLGIFSMQLGMRLLHDATGQKKVLFRLMEKHFLGYPLFSPLIPSDTLFFCADPFNLCHAAWANPWDASRISTESFFELYKKSNERYLAQMKKLYAVLHTDACEEHRRLLTADLLTEYGNLSFHSGLDVSIPS